MEYIYLPKKWQERLENNDIDRAIKILEYQIATNMQNVHNTYCDEKLELPSDVLYYKVYCQNINEELKKKLQPIIALNNEFVLAGYILEDDSIEAKEYVLEKYKTIENQLITEISKL